MAVWGGNQCVCCTCRYWIGKRDINLTCEFYESLEEKGKCCNPYGEYKGCMMEDSSSCSEWQSFL